MGREYFIRASSITVRLTTGLTCLELIKQVNPLFIHHKQTSSIKRNYTGQLCSDTSSYKVSKDILEWVTAIMQSQIAIQCCA